MEILSRISKDPRMGLVINKSKILGDLVKYVERYELKDEFLELKFNHPAASYLYSFHKHEILNRAQNHYPIKGVKVV